MQILEYDQVDPAGVLHLNLLSLGYALTPERVALIRTLDARPFPCFAVYAVEERIVAGQVGIYRLPVMTTEGPQEIGGACAVCTHPAFGRRGIANRLMDEAHARMREAGLHFSSLGTARHRGAHEFYLRQGYEGVFTPTSTFAHLRDIRQDTGLHAERAVPERLHLADTFYQGAAAGRLGFARRSRDYLAMTAATGDISAADVWLLWHGDELAGYALATISENILSVNSLLLNGGVEAWEAVAAIAKDRGVIYARARGDHPSVEAGLQSGGFPACLPGWASIMIKPLAPEFSLEQARRLLGVGTERFLISYIDVT
ncbi:MAG: hypothetical protein A2Z16_07325 [Chloroflexi bacterium RBG_16_54_18]|nr:MAG: hypothetical protein A2Z16_07325 [Chloroflexi bacterium RBG_16_54_18]